MPRFNLFCYTCKEHLEVDDKDLKDAITQFERNGHSNEKVRFLAPDLGRKSRKHERAVEKYV